MMNKFLALLTLIFLSACLPSKKETQCSENEAYDSARRSCVPVVGASTTNTVFFTSKFPVNSYSTNFNGSNITHSVAVSDSYNYGFSIKWNLYYQNNGSNTLVQVSTIDTYTFDPSTKNTGLYILEAILSDPSGVNQLDTVSWSITVNGQNNPTLITPSPNSPVVSVLNTSTAYNLSISADDPDGKSAAPNIGYYFIEVNDVEIFSAPFVDGTPITASINPSSLGTGIHTVEVLLRTNFANTSTVYDEYTWVVNVINPDYPVISSAGSVPSLSSTISIVDSTAFTANGWLDTNGTSLYNATTANVNICVSFDDLDKDGNGSSDIDVDFFISNASQPIVTQTPNLTTNEVCITDSDLDAALSYLSLANSDVAEAKSLTVVSKVAGTNTQLETYSWNIALRPQNIRPTITIDQTVADGMSCSFNSNGVEASGCTIIQSNDNNADGDFADASETSNTGYFAVNFQSSDDPDLDITDENQYGVFFEIKKVGSALPWDFLDGGSTYSKTNCYRTAGSSTTGTTITNNLTCELHFDAFNSVGTIEPGDYTVRAYISDNGSPYSAVAKDSNTVQWNVTVSELQSTNSITIASQGLNPTLNSWIEDEGSNTSCNLGTTGTIANTTSAAVSENGYIVVHTLIQDLERDDFYISVDLSNGNSSGITNVYPLTQVTISDNNVYYAGDNYYDAQVCIKVREWVISGLSQGTASVYVTVTDSPDAEVPQTETSQLDFLVDNNNPQPFFVEDPANLAILDTSPFEVYAGFPFTFDVDVTDLSTVVDTSQFDGNNVAWKWQVSTDTGVTFIDIPGSSSLTGATSSSLVWTPNKDIVAGSIVQIRLCIGDDGFGLDNDIANCSDGINSVQTKTWDNITVYPSIKESPASVTVNSSGSSLASWYDDLGTSADPSDDNFYIAYANGTNIYVEKYSWIAGQFNQVHSINFSAVLPYGSNPISSISSLSIDGISSESLILSYLTFEAGLPKFKLRRLNISNNKLSFDYCGFYNNDPTDQLTINTVTSTCTDWVDDTSSLFSSGDVSTSTGGNNSELTISISGVLSVGTLSLITPSGSTESFIYGGNWCSTGCSSPADVAADLKNLINSHTNPEISQELFVDYTIGAQNLTIIGPSARDYFDSSGLVTPSIGQIKLDESQRWYLPFTSTSTNQKLGIFRGSYDINNGLDANTAASYTNFATNESLLELSNDWLDTGFNNIAVAARNSLGNINMYSITSVSTGPSLSASNIINVFNDGTAGEQFEQIQLSVARQPAIANSIVHLSARRNNIATTVGDNNFLAIAQIKGDYTVHTATSNLAIADMTLDPFTKNIDSIKVYPNPSNPAESIIVATTDSNNGIYSNKLYISRVLNSDIVTFGLELSFREFMSPNLSNSLTLETGVISVGSIVPITLGNSNSSTSISGTPDNTALTLFQAWHTNNTGLNHIETGYFNIEESNITTSDESINGSYPSNVGK